MQQLAAAFGTFLGYALGHALRIAGPELQAFLVGVIRDAMQSKAEIAKPNDALQRELGGVADPSGLLGPNEGNLRAAGNGDEATQGNSRRVD